MTKIKNMEKLIDYFFKHWEKKSGLIILAIIIVIIFSTFSERLNIPLLLFTECLCFLIWAITTNRIVFPSRKHTVSIFIKIQESEKNVNIKNLIIKCITEVNRSPKIKKDVRILLRPLNKYSSVEEIKQAASGPFNISNLILFLELQSGNYNSDYVVKIENHCIIAHTDIEKGYLKLKDTALKIKDELNLRTLGKNWTYVESNSFNDSKKITTNLKDFILYSIGLYLLFIGELDIAIKILRSLYDSNNIITIPKTNSKTVRLTPEQIANSRLANILMNALFVSAINKYYHNNKLKAYETIKECEDLFPRAIQELDRYVFLARIAYECNDLESSQKYTCQLSQLPKGLFFSYVNNGFYSILNNDLESFLFYYTKVFNYKNTEGLNATETIAFLEAEKEANKELDENLINIAEGILMKLFMDASDGNKLLDECITACANDTKYRTILPLCEKVRNYQKSRSRHIYSKHRRKNKKRK